MVKALRLLYPSTLGLRVIKKKKSFWFSATSHQSQNNRGGGECREVPFHKKVPPLEDSRKANFWFGVQRVSPYLSKQGYQPCRFVQKPIRDESASVWSESDRVQLAG